jgi:hypothetical protein
MQVDETLPGLSRVGTRTGVIVVEQTIAGKEPQAALNEMRTAFSGARATEQGLRMEPMQNVTVAGFQAIAVTGTQKVAGTSFGKAIVAVAADTRMVIMTGTVEEQDPLTAQDILAVLTSARFSLQAAPGGLGFEITPAPGYERGESSAGQIYSLGKGTDVPKLIIAPSQGQTSVPAAQHRQFAVDRFGKLPSAPTPERTSEITVAGRPGFEIVGRDSEARTVYAVLLYTDTGYIVLAGDFDATKHPDQVPAFQAMAKSLVFS